MREIERLRRENASLRTQNAQLERRAADADQRSRAFADGEIDAAAAEGSPSPILFQAAQRALCRSEALFRVIVQKSVEAVSLTTREGVTRYLTPSVAHVLGWTPEELLTRSPRDHVVPDDRARLETEIQRMLRGGEGDNILEFRVRHRDESIRWVESRSTNLLDDPDVEAIVTTYRDITARKRDEAALRAGEERYRRIIETTSEGVWLSDATFTTTFVNQQMADMLGYTRQEMIGQDALAFVTPQGRVRARERFERRRRGIAESYQNEYVRKDGTLCWALVKTNPLFDDRGDFAGTVALLTDTTERRAFEEARNRLVAIVESSEDAIVSIALDGVITSWNLGAEKLYQYPASEALGASILLVVPPSLLDDERRILERVTRGEAVRQYETERRRKDGSVVEVAVTFSPVRDDAGAVVAVAKIARDLTARRAAEAAHAKVEEQLLQAQKMDAVGRLAGGIAHDFNNVLSVVLSYADLALHELKPGDPMRDDLQQVRTAARRATELTGQLLAFSRQQVRQPRVLDLGATVAGMDRMLRRLIGEDVELELVAASELGRVLADPGQIEQVILNLAVNARDAMPDGGRLTIETANVELDDAYASAHVDVTPGPHVMLSVRDTGTGMDAATRARIFDPFFTTKPVGKGTGLGLATVFGIVQQSGGHVGVSSEPGHGSTFEVYFPTTDRPPEISRSLGPREMLRGSETILLVEDEGQVRTVACAILRRHGYQVLEASNGVDAEVVSEGFAKEIHLLLTDVVMPLVNGRRLAEQLARRRPAMKVLFASGYTDDAIVHHGVLSEGVAFLQKPFTPEVLLQKVRLVLDGT